MNYSDKTYSGGNSSLGCPAYPGSLPNFLFTGVKHFFWAALGASLYWWPEKISREIIYVGLNTLSKSITIKI